MCGGWSDEWSLAVCHQMAFEDSDGATFAANDAGNALTVNYTFPSEDAKIQAVTYQEEGKGDTCDTVVQIKCKESGNISTHLSSCPCLKHSFFSLRRLGVGF